MKMTGLILTLVVAAGVFAQEELPRGGPIPAPQPDPPKPKPSFLFGRVIAPNAFLTTDNKKIVLAGVFGPADCGREAYAGEAERFLRDMLLGEAFFVHSDGVVQRARDGQNVNLAMLRNGYGCIDRGTLPMMCNLTYVLHEEKARQFGRGMWRSSPPLAEGYISPSRNAIEVLRARRAPSSAPASSPASSPQPPQVP